MMKRGTKICWLAVGAVVATAVLTFLLMNVALLSSITAPSLHATDVVSTPLPKRSLRHDGYLSLDNSSAIQQERDTTKARALKATIEDCGIDRSFAPECAGVSPQSWKLHRTVQAVGRIFVRNTYCSGVLLGNTSSAFFLTSATCLPFDAMAAEAQVEMTNCIGSQVFTNSNLFHVNRQLNYAVLRLSTRGFSVASHYGFLHMRSSGPAIDEAVFIAHYTGNFVKRISIISDDGLIRAQPAAVSECSATETSTNQVQFKVAQLDDAAVGAPLVSLSDYSVVGLHLCGGCKTGGLNAALSSKSILDDLASAGLMISAFVAPVA